MRGIRWFRVLTLGFSIGLITGCSDGNESAPTPKVEQSESPSPSIIDVPVIEKVSLTLDNMRSYLSLSLSEDQAKLIFGVGYGSEQSSLYWESNWVETRTWTYWREDNNAKLELQWSTAHELLYAIYHERVAGNWQTYIPDMGAIPEAWSRDSRLAQQAGLQIDREASVKLNTNGYAMIDSAFPRVEYLASPDRNLRIVALTETFVEIDDDGVHSWIPIWYFTDEAINIRDIEPAEMVLTKGEEAHWDPSSGATATMLKADEKVFAMQAYGDWIGVVTNDKPSQPSLGLLWVPRHSLISTGPWKPLFTNTTASQSDTVAAISKVELDQKVSKERVEQIFGNPQAIETTDNVDMPETWRTLPLWRYESADARLEITWETDGSLFGYRMFDRTQKNSYEVRDLTFEEVPTRISKLEANEKPWALTKPTSFEWRIQTDLPYNYLIATAGNTLIVAGEDGGFSGMHYRTQIFAVQKKSGNLLWKREIGLNGYSYAISSDGRQMVFLTIITDGSDQIARLDAIETSTGKSLWKKDITVDGSTWYLHLASSGSVVVASFEQKLDDQDVTYTYAYDMKRGQQLWSRKAEYPEVLVGQTVSMPLFLIHSRDVDSGVMGKLTAYAPLTGKVKWEITDLSTVNVLNQMFITSDERLSNESSRVNWVRTLEGVSQIDVPTGKMKASYPVGNFEQTHLEIINDKYMLIQQTNDHKSFYDSDDVTTSLVDMESGKVMWTSTGYGDKGVVDSDILYYRLNGKPRAVNIVDGNLVWEGNYTIQGKILVYGERIIVEEYPDVYVLDKKDGTVLYRMGDIRLGVYDSIRLTQLYGTITSVDGGLVVGSSNGNFSLLKPTLE